MIFFLSKFEQPEDFEKGAKDSVEKADKAEKAATEEDDSGKDQQVFFSISVLAE
jgi:hypothetical protein